MRIEEVIKKITVWKEWVDEYKKYVPLFIDEAKTKARWQDWDKDVFREFFEQGRDQCVSSLQQGHFNNEEKVTIKNNWNEIAPLLKQIAENQDVPLYNVYEELETKIRKYTTQHRRASTYRLIAGLQPNLLSTIVNRHSLKDLFNYLKKNIDEPLAAYTGNWYKDSYNVAQYYKKHIKVDNVMNLIAYPWQTMVYFRDGNNVNDNEMSEKTNGENNYPLNQILYGPPGTGKTYNTINKALSILESKSVGEINSETRMDLKNRFDNFIKDGQIVFTTFHQSMSYEDFIEGIKPETKAEKVVYQIVDGILKQLVKTAMVEYLENDSNVNPEDSFDSLFEAYTSAIKPLEGKRQAIFKTKTGVEIMLVEATKNSILVKYLWSNNKKQKEGQQVFTVSKDKLKKVLIEGIDPAKIKNLKAELHPLIGHIHCELYAVYKDFYKFIVENKGEIDKVQFEYKDLTYKEVKEQFDLLDKETIKNKIVKPYVLIIDEINRGNVSQIFGELITLIEEDKRLGKDEALEVTLPYSKEKFGVPANLYIIGTMNTADRSVEALDTALRRRFSFEEMPPLYDLEGLEDKVYGYPLNDILETINKRIVRLLNNDHAIGHSYFLNKDEETIIDSFNRNIIPLLQEYFFGDYGKMMLILGNGFVTYDEWQDEEKFFASYSDAKNDYDVKDLFSIKNYKKEDKQGFVEALKKLMNE